MAEEKAKTKQVPGLRITARKEGFRRAGIAHTAEPAEHPITRFSKEQVEQLRNEPQLVVQDCKVDVPADEA